ncbi:MAG: ribosome biogenesis GTP-binding protein YihA/YsxC [Acholeplasmatales bacterium]|jgi:GTP-binding protein|nr:ribosome biogenesis GTP-binding protein YihA/YsxC [Acholeplasmatales bacterium]
MIKESVFVKSIVNVQECLADKPTYLILGRSNVGKSSFINALLNRKNLARVSGTPGKTIFFNYFLVNNEFYLLDSPGYGYAKRSKTSREGFINLINDFITKVDYQGIIQLIDFKVGPTEDDIDVNDYLHKNNHDVTIICTKKDKINRSGQAAQLKIIKEKLISNPTIYAVSNTTKDGFDKVMQLFI